MFAAMTGLVSVGRDLEYAGAQSANLTLSEPKFSVVHLRSNILRNEPPTVSLSPGPFLPYNVSPFAAILNLLLNHPLCR